MKTLLTIVGFATLAAFLGVLGWSVPRPDLLGVLAATLALAFWDLFFHDRVRMRAARNEPGREEAALAPELDEPGTVRDDGRPVDGLER